MFAHRCHQGPLLVLAAVAVVALLSQADAHGAHLPDVMGRDVKSSRHHKHNQHTAFSLPRQTKQSRSSPHSFHTAEDQAKAVTETVMRLLPDHGHLFHISIDLNLAPDDMDTVQVLSPLVNGTVGVSVTGSGGVAAAWGVLHYLKQYCHCHISWEADQLSLPQTLPAVNVTIKAKDRVRYYQNVCTVSYSSVWWQWPRWEREIDWMALNGINLALAFTGQEALWRRVYLDLGLTDVDLQSFFTGPTFLAWHRMGNLMGWGGPLPLSWHNATELLQKKILRRMRELGITPVLPCFAGHVPKAIKRVFPNANVTRQAQWRQFNDTYTRTFMLQPTDPLYHKIGTMFMDEMRKAYNFTDGVYNCDPFNEMEPHDNSTHYISSVATAIYGPIRAVDPSAVWLMQAWMFVSERDYWTQDLAKALFTAVPQGRILVLDVSAANIPVWDRYNSFYGQPFVFCMMLNNGGVDGLSGYTQRLFEMLKKARTTNNTLVGSGLTMEGINQNYVMYDLMMEMAWEDPPTDILEWAAQYSSRRYGTDSLQDVWRTLMMHIYNNTKMSYHGQHTLARRPTLDAGLVVWYPLSDLLSAWDGLIGAANATTSEHMRNNFPVAGPSTERGGPQRSTKRVQNSTKRVQHSTKRVQHSTKKVQHSTKRVQRSTKKVQRSTKKVQHSTKNVQHGAPVTEQTTYRHDLVDVTREVLQDLFGLMAEQLVQEYENNSFQGVMLVGDAMTTLLTDLDELLVSSPAFLLGKWSSDAAAWGTTEQEKRLYIYNALNQITLWGPPPPQGDLDYAVKQWAGVVGNYFLPRWEVFVDALLVSIVNNTTLDNDKLNEDLLMKVEEPFTFSDDKAFPSEPVGDSLSIGLRLYQKYRPQFSRYC